VCNPACLEFIQRVVAPADVAGRSVLEVGAYDVNGSARSVLQPLSPASYVGVDIELGPGVDEIVSVDRLLERFGKEAFDLVVSTELIEHVADWRTAVSNLKGVVCREGSLVMTTRSKGFPYHGYPDDYWRFEAADLRQIFADFHIAALEPDPSEPGVFLKATKPRRFRERRLGRIDLYSMAHDRRVRRQGEAAPR
jgi:SAM-dependent methyltransferase